jgi:carnitine-CoA ligase
LWTSGTTGRSKGVMQSHNVWFQAALEGDDMYDTRPGDVAYNVMPMYNSGAWATSLFRSLFCGITLAVDPAFSVSSFWDRVRFYGATQSFTIGAMHMFLWNAPPRPDDADNPLRELQAVPMPSTLEEPFARRFGVRVLGRRSVPRGPRAAAAIRSAMSTSGSQTRRATRCRSAKRASSGCARAAPL